MGSTISTGISKSLVVDEVNASPETMWLTATDFENMPQFISALKEIKELDTPRQPQHRKKRQIGLDPTPKAISRQLNKENATLTRTIKDGKDSDKNREVKEGSTWEETRWMLGKQSKMITCVTSIGLITNLANISCDSSGLPDHTIQKHQKYIRMHLSVLDKIGRRYRLEFKTWTATFNVAWDEIVNDAVHGNDVHHSTHTTSDASMGLSKTPSISSIPTKCQFTITMAFIPKNVYTRVKIMMARLFGVDRIINRTLQLELDELVKEAERREKRISQNRTSEPSVYSMKTPQCNDVIRKELEEYDTR
jgi:hypothetical protein